MNLRWLGELLPQVVDVFMIHFALSHQLVEDCLKQLSSDEVQRAMRLRRTVERNQWIISRAIIRQVLGLYLNCPPEEVGFQVGEHGKPKVAGLEFNTSHSGSTVAIAVSKTAPVGIDIEFSDRDVNFEQVARLLFSADERTVWQALSQLQRRPVFFETWVAKEAALKARGVGLNQSLPKISVVKCELAGQFIVLDPTFEGKMAGMTFSNSNPALCGAVVLLNGKAIELRVCEQTVTTLN